MIEPQLSYIEVEFFDEGGDELFKEDWKGRHTKKGP